jgi:hypothetical protein
MKYSKRLKNATKTIQQVETIQQVNHKPAGAVDSSEYTFVTIEDDERELSEKTAI